MEIKRRTFNQLMMGAAVTGFTVPGSPASATVTEIRLCEGGGLNGDAIEKAYAQPFTAETGIKVIRENPNPFGKLRALVESKSHSTTLWEMGNNNLAQAKALGLIEKLDWAKISPMAMFREAQDDYGFGYQYYSTLMAWREGEKPLRTWADFFNVKEFPGKRALADDPVDTLAAAALAAGASLDKIYPIDVERAFAKLDEIKDSVSVWWQAGAQSPQLLRDNEVQYASAYSGRVVGQKGLEYTYNQASLSVGYIAIVKDSPSDAVEAAYEFFRVMSDPKNQVVAGSVLPYSGSSPDFEKLIGPGKAAAFPTSAANKGLQFINDGKWWLENAEMVQKRWQEFALNR